MPEVEEEIATPSVEDRLAAFEAREAARTLESERATLLASVVPADRLGGAVGQMFARSYNGELTAEAVRAEAVNLGLVEEQSAADAAGTADASEREAHGSLLDLRAGATPPGSEPGPHPNTLAREVAVNVRKIGTEDEALGAYIESQARSLLGGDGRNGINLLAGAGAVRGRNS